MRYSAESTVLPTTAHDLLEWAAAHIESRGFHDGRDGQRFGHDGSTTTTALLRPGILGALDVAGGDGRRSSGRMYDYPALYAAQRLALDTLADLTAGGAVAHDPDWTDEYRHRRYVAHAWGTQDGRTRAEAVALFREAAGLADDATAAATRPGRPPARLDLPTTGDVLGWAAAHIEAAGHRPGGLAHDPDGFAGTAPCTMLHALDRAGIAAKPIPAEGRAQWAAYGKAVPAALRLLAEHVAGGPVEIRVGEEGRDVIARRRAVVLAWGNAPGRSGAEVAAAFRAAMPAGDAGAAEGKVPAELGQVSFF